MGLRDLLKHPWIILMVSLYSVGLTGSNGGIYKDTPTRKHVITNQITASFNLVDFIYLMIAPGPFWRQIIEITKIFLVSP